MPVLPLVLGESEPAPTKRWYALRTMPGETMAEGTSLVLRPRRQEADTKRSRGRLSLATIVAVVITLGVTAAGTWGTYSVVRDQERRLLTGRASEVGLLFTSAISGVTSSLTATRGVLRATDGSASAFARAVDEQVSTEKASKTTLALLAPVAGGDYRVVNASGPLLSAGQLISGDRAATFDKTRSTPTLVSTPVLGSGASTIPRVRVGRVRRRRWARAVTCSTASRRSASCRPAARLGARPSTR